MPVMLQHNAHRAHVAHAALIGLHGLCCGAPTLAMLAAGFAGAASGASLFSESLGKFHLFLHAYEGWIVVLSALLLGLGAALEGIARRGRRARGFPWLLAVSALCFSANLVVVLGH